MDKAEHQERGEPERYAAEYIDGGNGVADRPWFGSRSEPGNIRHDPGDRSTERGTERTEDKADAVLRYSSEPTLSIARATRCTL
jgi:hypothetical protein